MSVTLASESISVVRPSRARVASPPPPTPRAHGRFRWTHLGLLALCVVVFGLNAHYLRRDRTPQHWDSSNHLLQSIDYHDQIARFGLEKLVELTTSEYRFYPPGFHLLTAPAFSVFGRSIGAALVWQSLYLVLTMAAVAFLAGRSYGPRLGLVAAATYACFPIVLGFSRMAFIENLLALEVALVAVLALPLRALQRPALAVVLGVLVGFGQLTKWQFVFYAGPLLAMVFVAEHRRARGAALATRLVGASLVVLVSLALCAPWYVLHLDRILADLRYHGYERDMGDAPVWSAKGLLYYVQAFPWQMVGVPISAVLGFAVVKTLVDRKRDRGRFILLASCLASAFLLTWSRHKEGRFLLPVLPLVAVVLLGAVASAPPLARRAALATLLLFGPVNAVAQTFPLGRGIRDVTVPIGLERRGFIVRRGTPEWLMWPIQRADWAFADVFAEIERSASEARVRAAVHCCLEADHPYYNLVGFWSKLLVRGGMREALTHDAANYCVSHGAGLAAGPGPKSDPAFVELRMWGLPDGTAVRLFRRSPDDEAARVRESPCGARRAAE